MKKIFLLIGLITVGTLAVAQQPNAKDLKKKLRHILAEKSIQTPAELKKMSVQQLEALNIEIGQEEKAVDDGRNRALVFLKNREEAAEELRNLPLAEQEKEVIAANDNMQDRINLSKGKGQTTIRAINLSMYPITDLSIRLAVDNRFIEQTLDKIAETTVYMKEGAKTEEVQGLLKAVVPLVYFTNALKEAATSKEGIEEEDAHLIAAYMGSVSFKTLDKRKVPLRSFLLNVQKDAMLAEYNGAISAFLDNVEEGEAFAVKQIERLEKN